ncbi:MAG TPA: TetR/AcrR family transcriptional regulator [Methylomusa anaerophila]|uniref:Division inhibitor protein n=1 Tax=Methylomusa anaerophila TaxID=1930071 RepID=A0A348AHZ3_9FIRM|nr:TetR/AcrR family transcriptional regulator [Methylomusa anaerophila]BBB90691.1 division inhibitor protein [Methylomusa anaerophila]HML88706.1 TetR/AcrR family transcriptional regulator [Methylomusa anaerophila]
MKERILKTAAEEMNERGVKFTVDAVAARLGISKKTLYQYFESKDHLIASIVDAAIVDMANQKAEIMNSNKDFVSKLAAIVTVEPKIFGKVHDWVLEDIKRHRPEDWERITCFRRERTQAMAKILEEGIAGGHIRRINTAVAAQMLCSAVGEFLEYGFLAENNISFTDALQALTDIFLYGVLTEKPALE